MKKIVMFSNGLDFRNRFVYMRYLTNHLFLQNLQDACRQLNGELEVRPEGSIYDLLDRVAMGDPPDAVIVYRSADHFARIRAALPPEVPVIFYGSSHWLDAVRDHPHLIYDEKEIMNLALDHLQSVGVRRVAISVFDTPVFGTRLRLFQDGCRRHGLDHGPEDVVQSVDESLEDGPAQIVLQYKASLDRGRPWNALLLGSDILAQPLFALFRAAGVTIPEELAVVGINRHPLAFDCVPPLTAVDLPVEEDAYTMAMLLEEALAGGTPRKRSDVRLVPGFSA